MYNNCVWHYENAERVAILCNIDGQPSCVPALPADRHYRRIVALVEAENLTIAEPE